MTGDALQPDLEPYRGLIWGVAYRMTGTTADADDIVQTTFARALSRRPDDDRPLRPWLVTVAMNLSRDLLRRRRRRKYVGPWLPAPLAEPVDPALPPSARYDAQESASFAFLVALEALTPQRRAVLILRDVLDYSVEETAQALGITASNAKVTHHRARRALADYDGSRQPQTPARTEAQQAAIGQFLAALAMRDVTTLESLLAEDVRMTNDGGGIFVAALKPLDGRRRVRDFLLGVSSKMDASTGWFDVRPLSGEPALLTQAQSSTPRAARTSAMLFTVTDDGLIERIYIQLNPEKLSAIAFPLGLRPGE